MAKLEKVKIIGDDVLYMGEKVASFNEYATPSTLERFKLRLWRLNNPPEEHYPGQFYDLH